MKIRILSLAVTDIEIGQHFYEQQHAIYYQLKDETIEVWRVLDCRESPAKTESALQLK